MPLTHSQKKYLKKNIKHFSLTKIAADLRLPEKEILNFLKSHWRKEKYEKFVKGVEKNTSEVAEWTPRRWKNLKEAIAQNWKIFLFLTFLVFAVYLNSLGNDFVSDDIGSIRDNQNIGKLDYIIYFKDLRSLVIFLTHKLFGLNPLFYRFSNILFHLGSTWVIYLLISLFFRSPIPLITASIFAVHPILTESVTWISGGPYSNAAFFALLSLLIYVIWSTNIKKTRLYFASVILFFLGLLFNEKIIVLPAILFLYEFCFGKLKDNWPKLIPFWGISGFWVLRLLGLLGTRITSLETTFYQEPGIENPLIQIPIAITSYLKLIFWPKNLTLYHSEMSFTQAEYLLRLGGFLLFLLTTAYFFKKDRRIFFWLSFFLITLLPTLTPLKIAWIVAERYVYLGTLGIIILLAWAIQKIGEITQNQKIAYALLVVILMAFSLRTIVRNTDWKNQDTLWLATARVSPSSPQNHNNLGDYYARRGDLEKAAAEFKKAIELNPRYGDAYHNLANSYQQMGKPEEAIENYQKALSFNSSLWQSYQNSAAIYFEQEKYNLAEENFQKAIVINPQNSNLHTNLGIIYLKMNNSQKAKKTLQAALTLDPTNQKAKQLLMSIE